MNTKGHDHHSLEYIPYLYLLGMDGIMYMLSTGSYFKRREALFLLVVPLHKAFFIFFSSHFSGSYLQVHPLDFNGFSFLSNFLISVYLFLLFLSFQSFSSFFLHVIFLTSILFSFSPSFSYSSTLKERGNINMEVQREELPCLLPSSCVVHNPGAGK